MIGKNLLLGVGRDWSKHRCGGGPGRSGPGPIYRYHISGRYLVIVEQKEDDQVRQIINP